MSLLESYIGAKVAGGGGGGEKLYLHTFEFSGIDYYDEYRCHLIATVILTNDDTTTDFSKLKDILPDTPCYGGVYSKGTVIYYPPIKIDDIWYNEDDDVWKIGIKYFDVDGYDRYALFDMWENDVKMTHTVKPL